MRDAKKVEKVTLATREEEDQKASHFRLPTEAFGARRDYAPDVEFYDSSSDEELGEHDNTVGPSTTIPPSWYALYDHFGYNATGKKLLKRGVVKSKYAEDEVPFAGAGKFDTELDRFLGRVDDPDYWRSVRSEMKAANVMLTEDELDSLRSAARRQFPTGMDPTAPENSVVEFGKFSAPLASKASRPEAFSASKMEFRAIRKIIKKARRAALRGETKADDGSKQRLYDIWADPLAKAPFADRMPPPKEHQPMHSDSYRPPEEFIPTEAKMRARRLEAEVDNLPPPFEPKRYDSLRTVPQYPRAVHERYRRAMELFSTPRQRKVVRTPDETVARVKPDLPDLKQYKPYPNKLARVFVDPTLKRHPRVRAVAVDRTGLFVATGSEDGIVRIYELATGHLYTRLGPYEDADSDLDDAESLSASEDRERVIRAPITSLSFVEADSGVFILAFSSGISVYLLNAGALVGTVEQEEATAAVLEKPAAAGNGGAATWSSVEHGVQVRHNAPDCRVVSMTFHARGDYFATTMRPSAVYIHQLSRAHSQIPIKRADKEVRRVAFHPKAPALFVATRTAIRLINLLTQKVEKILAPGAKSLATFDVHPLGENVLVGAHDAKTAWIDMELSTRPFKKLMHHHGAVRAVSYHPTLPLFATGADDALVGIFHGAVGESIVDSTTIVPLKLLRGHRQGGGLLGVLDLTWVHSQPYVVSAGADGTTRLWVPG
jgi:ribosome biogenesis protein ERB1